MIRTIVVASLIAFTSCAAFCQSFEAASIKPGKPGGGAMKGPSEGSISFSAGSVTMSDVTLKNVITTAYGIKDYQLSGPAWIESDRYDILAKAAASVPVDQLKLMLQALLADRFELALHREAKDLTVNALVAGKNGPKLHNTKPESESGMQISGGSLVFQNYSMPKLAGYLSQRSPGPPVTDATGINGDFDFTVQLLDSPSGNPVDVKRAFGQATRDGSLARIVAEQLGLRLETRKGPVEILVIDHAEKASGN